MFIPFIEGVNTNNQPQVDEDEAVKRHKEIQKQRYYERKIREAKRSLNLAKEIGDEETIKRYSNLVRSRQDKLRQYIADHNLPRMRDRERIYALGGKSPEITTPVVPRRSVDSIFTEIEKDKDLREYLKPLDRKYKIKSRSFTGLDFEFKKKTVQAMEKAIERYPFLDSERITLTTSKGAKTPLRLSPRVNAVSSYYRGRMELIWNESKIAAGVDSYNLGYRSNLASGWSVQAGDDGILKTTMHEIGHLLHFEVERKKKNFSKRIQKAVIKELNLSPEDIASGLSRYATVNESEFFAESFAEWMLSPEPRPIAQTFGRILEDELRKGGYIE